MGNAVSPIGGMGGAPAFNYYQDDLAAEGTSGQLDTYQPPEDAGIFQDISDFLSRGLARLAQGFVESFAASSSSKGFGCSSSGSIGYLGPTEPTMPPPPPPPPPQEEAPVSEPTRPNPIACQKVTDALESGKEFHVIQVWPDLFVVGKVGPIAFALDPMSDANSEKFRLAAVTLAPELGPAFCTMGKELSAELNLKISARVKRFIEDHAKIFESLRDQVQYGSVGKAPPDLNPFIIEIFRHDEVAKSLAKEPGLQQGPGESKAEFLKRRFKNAGIEFAKDEKNQITYYAIYSSVTDWEKKNPPRFFVIEDGNGKTPAYSLVHNYDAVSKRYFVGPLEGAQPILQNSPGETPSKNRKIIPGLKFKYNDLPDYALRCGPHHPINEGQNLREEFQKIDQGKGDGFIEQKETQLDEKEFNRLKTKVSEFKELVKKKSQDCDWVGSQLDPFKINKIHLARKEILKLAKIQCTQDCE